MTAVLDVAPYTPKDVCAYCRWPIDFTMPGLDVAVCNPQTKNKWMHSVCADHYRGWTR